MRGVRHSGGFLKAFGPGMLLAGNAVGASHLVQSTRAGAMYGLALVLIIVLTNVLKYPAFAFGPWYASATGTSLLEGYRRQGRWALGLYGVITTVTILAAEAAVTLVTAGLAIAVFNLEIGVVPLAALILGACAAVVAVGYRWVDRLMKLVMAVLALSTVMAAALVLPSIDWSQARLLPDAATWRNEATMVFLVALIGWMPTPFDISVWHSLWTIERRRDSGHAPSLREALFDFKIGYLGAAGLAVCFVILGAGVMYGSGAEFPESSAEFAAQLIALYEQTLGPAAGVLIGVCAMFAMFSTTLSVVDGSARALASLRRRFSTPESFDDAAERKELRVVYWAALAFFALGALTILQFFGNHLIGLVTVAMTGSFIGAPVFAILNHRAVQGAEIPPELRPGRGMMAFSLLGIAALSLFTLYYFYWLLTS
jgi:Mn2+/Fe2+ NRAMP family transporter